MYPVLLVLQADGTAVEKRVPLVRLAAAAAHQMYVLEVQRCQTGFWLPVEVAELVIQVL